MDVSLKCQFCPLDFNSVSTVIPHVYFGRRKKISRQVRDQRTIFLKCPAPGCDFSHSNPVEDARPEIILSTLADMFLVVEDHIVTVHTKENKLVECPCCSLQLTNCVYWVHLEAHMNSTSSPATPDDDDDIDDHEHQSDAEDDDDDIDDHEHQSDPEEDDDDIDDHEDQTESRENGPGSEYYEDHTDTGSESERKIKEEIDTPGEASNDSEKDARIKELEKVVEYKEKVISGIRGLLNEDYNRTRIKSEEQSSVDNRSRALNIEGVQPTSGNLPASNEEVVAGPSMEPSTSQPHTARPPAERKRSYSESSRHQRPISSERPDRWSGYPKRPYFQQDQRNRREKKRPRETRPNLRGRGREDRGFPSYRRRSPDSHYYYDGQNYLGGRRFHSPDKRDYRERYERRHHHNNSEY